MHHAPDQAWESIARLGRRLPLAERRNDSHSVQTGANGRVRGYGLAICPPGAKSDQSDGHEDAMEEVSLARAKAHLSELVERAARGEPIRITRRGKAVARLTGIERQPRAVDLEALQALTQSMLMQPTPARSWLRSVRDDSRY